MTPMDNYIWDLLTEKQFESWFQILVAVFITGEESTYTYWIQMILMYKKVYNPQTYT